MGLFDFLRKKRVDVSPKTSKISTGRFCSFNGDWCEKDICDNCKTPLPAVETSSTLVEATITQVSDEKSFEEKVAELNKAAENNLIKRAELEQRVREQAIELERIRVEETLPELPHIRPKHKVTPNVCGFCSNKFANPATAYYHYYNDRPHIETVPEQYYLPYTCDYCGGTYCDEHRLPENHNCVILQHRAWKYYKAYKSRNST